MCRRRGLVARGELEAWRLGGVSARESNWTATQKCSITLVTVLFVNGRFDNCYEIVQ